MDGATKSFNFGRRQVPSFDSRSDTLLHVTGDKQSLI